MATRQQLEDALVKAHEAGDTEAAALFADDIRNNKFEGTAKREDPRAAFDHMNPLMKLVTAGGDISRIANDSIYGGWADKGIAALKSKFGGGDYGKNLATERAATEDARVRAGSAGDVTSVAAPVAVGAGASRMGMSLLNSGANLPFLQRLLGTAAGAGVEGATYGAIDAAGHDRDVQQGANTGALFGVGGGAAAESVGSLAGKLFAPKRTTAPTVDELEALSQAGRDRVAASGIDINPDAIADLNRTLRDRVGEGNPQGARAARHPATISELDRLREYSPSQQDPTSRARRTVSVSDGNTTTTTSTNGNPPVTRDVDRFSRGDVERRSTTYNTEPDRGMSLYDLDQHRQTVQDNVGRHADRAERRMGFRTIDEMDKFAKSLDNTRATAPAGTDIQAEVENLVDTRAIDHRLAKLDDVGSVVRASDLGEAASGVETGTRLRSGMAGILKDERKSMGFSPDELAQMREVVEGSRKANMLAKAGKFASGLGGAAVGGGLGAAGGAMFGGVGAGLGGAAGTATARIAGTTLNNMASRETNKQALELLDTIARGGTRMPKPRSGNAIPRDQQEAFIRALTLLGLEDETAK